MVVIIDGKSKSLSDGGMAMFAGTELQPGNRIAIEFTPPYSLLPIRLEATVCTRTGYLYGVEFVTGNQNSAADFRRQMDLMRVSKKWLRDGIAKPVTLVSGLDLALEHLRQRRETHHSPKD